MSTYRESKDAYKKNLKTEKKCKDCDEEIIECNIDNNFIEIMKNLFLMEEMKSYLKYFQEG